MENEIKKERLLGAQEILFYAMNEASSKHFLMAAEILGKTDLQAWSAAAAQVQKLHPLLNVSITRDGDNLLFTHSGNTEAIFESGLLLPSFRLETAIEEELERGFRSDAGSLARIKVFHSMDKSVVIISAHHSISDALSSVYLISDLLQLLAGKSITGFALQPSVDEYIGFSNEGLATKINAQITPGKPLPHEFTRYHPKANVDILHFSADLTALVAESAKKRNTTVHGALQAAAALAIAELSFTCGRPAYIMSPFSVRKEMNAGTGFGLFIDTKIVAVETDQHTDFWNIARTAEAGLADVHTPEFLKTSAGQLRGLIGFSDNLIQFIKDNFNFDIMLSNLGRLSIDESGLKVASVAGPFIISGFNNQQAVGAATCDGKLVLTNSSRYPVPGLLNAIQKLIEKACAA